jgi:hypothetical protein
MHTPDVLAALDLAVNDAKPEDFPTLLGHLERVKAHLWAQLVAPAAQLPTPTPVRGMSVKAAAQQIGISASLIYKRWQTEFPFCRRVRGRIVCDSAALDAWLSSASGLSVKRRAA